MAERAPASPPQRGGVIPHSAVAAVHVNAPREGQAVACTMPEVRADSTRRALAAPEEGRHNRPPQSRHAHNDNPQHPLQQSLHLCSPQGSPHHTAMTRHSNPSTTALSQRHLVVLSPNYCLNSTTLRNGGSWQSRLALRLWPQACTYMRHSDKRLRGGFGGGGVRVSLSLTSP